MGRNLDVIERGWELFESNHLDRMGEVAVPDVRLRMPGIETSGIESVRMVFAGWKRAFPDLHHRVLASVESGDCCALEIVIHGRHTGPLAGPLGEIPATGRMITMESCDFITLRDGMITTWHSHFDNMDLLSQLGLEVGEELMAGRSR